MNFMVCYYKCWGFSTAIRCRTRLIVMVVNCVVFFFLRQMIVNIPHRMFNSVFLVIEQYIGHPSWQVIGDTFTTFFYFKRKKNVCRMVLSKCILSAILNLQKSPHSFLLYYFCLPHQIMNHLFKIVCILYYRFIVFLENVVNLMLNNFCKTV